MKLFLFAILTTVLSYWIWRIFFPYPWADILAILGGVAMYFINRLSISKIKK